MVKTRNRLLGVLLSLTIAFGLLAGVSMNAAAEETPHVHAVSTDCSTSDGEQVTFDKKLTSTGGALASGNYYLDDDLELDDNLIIYTGVTVNLCLNGHVLTGDGSGDAVITSNGVLNLCDCNGSDGTHKFTVDSETGLWKADD
ncbi:MAG: hypothetical protein HUJ65_06625, partial [Oscillospiraceae bacterium]|nr:hypothetical protein [Oscillospiraceae bacterium]